MESIIFSILLIITIVLFWIIFKININKAKDLQENKELEKITDKFPKNIEIAKEMLDMLENKGVKIEEAKNTETSLYIAVTNKILIADLKNNYARIQTIAHECLHSCQDRTLLLFNYIFSNINILYFFVISILTICKVIHNQMLQIAILMLLMFIQLVVRNYLETDAMTRSRFLAEKYIEKKKIIEKKEQEKLLKQYNEINRMGIPFTIWNLLLNGFVKIIIYCIICLVV